MTDISFIAIDFETATGKRHSICEVGICVVVHGQIIETRSWLVRPDGYDFEYKRPNCVREGIFPHIETWLYAGNDSWLTLRLFARNNEDKNNPFSFYLNASIKDLECEDELLDELNTALSEIGFDFIDEDNLNSYYDFDVYDYALVKKAFYQIIDDIQQLINDIVNAKEQ